jgi:hypothetical protein
LYMPFTFLQSKSKPIQKNAIELTRVSINDRKMLL